MYYLSEHAKLSIATTTTAGAAAQTEIDGAGLDMAGYDGLLVIVPIGTIVSGGAQSVKLQQSDDDGVSDGYSDIAGTSQTIADDDDNQTVYVDLQRPGKRYVRVVVLRATQNSTFGGITYVQYHAGKRNVTHGTNVSGETHMDKAEGTA